MLRQRRTQTISGRNSEFVKAAAFTKHICVLISSSDSFFLLLTGSVKCFGQNWEQFKSKDSVFCHDFSEDYLSCLFPRLLWMRAKDRLCHDKYFRTGWQRTELHWWSASTTSTTWTYHFFIYAAKYGDRCSEWDFTNRSSRRRKRRQHHRLATPWSTDSRPQYEADSRSSNASPDTTRNCFSD